MERVPSNLRKTSELPVAYLLSGVPESVYLQLLAGVASNQPIAGFPVFLPFGQLTVYPVLRMPRLLKRERFSATFPSGSSLIPWNPLQLSCYHTYGALSTPTWVPYLKIYNRFLTVNRDQRRVISAPNPPTRTKWPRLPPTRPSRRAACAAPGPPTARRSPGRS